MNKKIKICFISRWIRSLFYPETTFRAGGGEVQLYLLGNELSNLSTYQICYLVGDFDQPKKEFYDKIILYKSSKPLFGLALHKMFIGIIRNFIDFILVRADLYINRAAGPILGLLALYCKLFKKKLIFMSAHDMDCTGEYENQNNSIFSWLYTFGLKNSDLVITQSEYQQKKMMDHHHVSSVVIKSLFTIEDKNVQKKSYTLWVGRCSWWKRPELFIELAKKNPDDQFMMISPPAANEQDFYHKLMDDIKLVKNLIYIKSVPFDQIQKYFDEASIFVNTSQYEGFPNTFFQSGLSKTPILSMNANPDDFLNKNECGLFANNDLNKFLTYYQDLKNNKELWNKLSQNSFNYLKNNHDKIKISKIYDQKIKELFQL